jgi:hypothetical protein
MPETSKKYRSSLLTEGPDVVVADTHVAKMTSGSPTLSSPVEVGVTKEERAALKQKVKEKQDLVAQKVRDEIAAEEAIRARRL